MHKPALAAVLLVTLAGLAAAQPPAGDEGRALGFVAAVASGDADALVAYMRQNFDDELWGRRDADGWRRLAQQLTANHRGIEPAQVEIQEPGRVIVVGDSPDGTEITFGFDFADDGERRIAGLSLEAGRGAGHGGGPRLAPPEIPAGASADEIAEALDGWFAALEDFSGAALVAIDGKPIFRTARGLASRRWNVPNRVDTRFDLGSINKSFTKIAIGQLVAAGKLSLDDTIADHLPDYPNPEVAAKVRIDQLVDHSAGLGDIFNDTFFRSSRSLYREPRDFFPLFADEPLLFEPGARTQYSNAGYMVLGAIIEAASGQSYYDYVAEHIFAPAGMTATGFFAADEPEPNVAEGYTRFSPGGDPSKLRSNVLMLPARGNSAGSAQSTVDDLLAFDNALREHRLLSPAYTDWYFGGPPPAGDGDDASAARATVATGIAGGAPGVSAVVESDDRLAVIVLANQDEPGAETVAQALVRPLRRALR